MVGESRQIGDGRSGVPRRPLLAERRQSIEADVEQLRQKLGRRGEQLASAAEGRVGGPVRLIAARSEPPKTLDLLATRFRPVLC